MNMAIFQTKAMYVNQNLMPNRDAGRREENSLGSNFSDLGLSDRSSRPKDPVPSPRAVQKSSPSPDSRNTSPESLVDDSYVVVDDHDSISPQSDLQSWVRQPAQMSSSVDSEASLNTCLNRAQQLSKSAHQRAYEQNQLLNNFPAKLPDDFDGGFSNRGRSDESQEIQALAKKLEECEKAKADGKNEATELRHQVDQLRDENQRLSSIVQDMRSFGETDSLKAQLKSLGNEKMVLQMQLGECERRAHQKDEELKKMMNTVSKNAVDSQEVNFLRLKMEDLKQEKMELRAKYTEKANALEAEKVQLMEDLAQQSRHVRKLEENMKKKSEDAEQKLKYMELYEVINQDNEKLKKEVEHLTSTQIKWQSESETYKLELSRSKELIESLQEELKTFKFSENRIKTEAAALKQWTQEMDEESKRLRKYEKDSKQKEENLTSIIQQLQKQLEESKRGDLSLQEERNSLKAAVQDMEEDNDLLKRKLQEAEQQALKLAQQDPSYEEVGQYATQCHQALQQKDMEIKQYYDACHHLHLQLQQIQTASSSGNDELRSINANLIKELHEVRETASANMAKLAEAQNQFEEFKRTDSKKDGQIYELEKKFKEANDQIELYKIQLTDFEKDFNDERKRANDLKNQFEIEKETHIAKNEELEAENKELKLRMAKLDQIKMEEDERALGARTRHTNERNAAGPAPGATRGDNVVFVSSQTRRPNANDRSVNGYQPQFNSSMDLSHSGRYGMQESVRGSVTDLRQNPQDRRGGAVPQREPSFSDRVGSLFNPRKGTAQPTERNKIESLVCPFCNERNFPNSDGLQVHINEDHPEA